MRRLWIVSLLFVLVVVSCARPTGGLPSIAELSTQTTAAGAPVVTVFKAPT